MSAPVLQRLAVVLALCWVAVPRLVLGATALQQLDISLVAFDPGIPDDPLVQGAPAVFPEVRRAEASYLPFVLRQTLAQADQWGVVRVVPETDPSAELLISGTIVRSDGMVLEIALKVSDCTGREWLDKTYKATSSKQDFSSARARSEPLFGSLFRQINDELYNAATALGAREIEHIEQVSTLLYARSLVPDAFSDYLRKSPSGIWELQRLPAANDPLIARIQRVREREYLFVDAVDEQYATLYDQMTPSYDLWRKFIREQSSYESSHTGSLTEKRRRGLGAYQSMRQIYDAYKWSKSQQLEVALVATGLNNELSPTLLEIDGRLVSLDGSLQQRYQKWRRILHELFLLETGVDGTSG